jgi:hypothetical protein
MAVNKKDRQRLSGQILTSARFRENFLKNPKKAAASLGIKLSEKDHREALSQVERLRAAAEAAEEAIRGATRTPAEPLGGAVPGWILD